MSEAPSTGRRAQQRARVRYEIAKALEQRLCAARLEDITVDELAAAAGVSRMTFFNHFGTKEHALDHVVVVLVTRLEASVRARSVRGLAGVEHIFAEMGAFQAESPERGRRMVAHFATRPLDRPVPSLEPAERLLFGFGELASPTFGGLGGLFISLLDEARADGELAVDGSSYELGHLLGSLLLGASMVGHSNPTLDWGAMYRAHARRVVTMLRGGVAPAKARARSARPEKAGAPQQAKAKKTTKKTTKVAPSRRARA